jgi:hypothetical protein
MTNETNQVALSKLIKEAQDNHSPIATQEAAKFLSKVYKTYFDEYVKVGFTELQALRLTVGNFN